MYSVNGIALDNPDMGWVLRAPSKPLSAFSYDRPNLTATGRDGVLPFIPPSVSPVSVSFVVQTPRAHLEHLLALFEQQGTLTVTGSQARAIDYETLSSTPVGYGPADSLVDVTFLLRFPEPFWRDFAVSNSPTFSLSTGGADFNLWPGLSAPVGDALVKARGPHSGLSLLDASGAWVNLPSCSATETVVFDSATGEAGKNTSNTFALITDVSGAVDFGGPRGVFEITPQRRDPDPRIRHAELMASATGVGATTSLAFRGRAAYLLA